LGKSENPQDNPNQDMAELRGAHRISEKLPDRSKLFTRGKATLMSVFANSWFRWTTWFVTAVVFAAACVVLANWQLDRRDQAVSKIERMVENYDKPALDFFELEELSLDEISALEWTPIEIKGSYLIAEELLIRNRPIAGQPGFLQVLPFELTSGQVVLIERGWIPADSDLAPASVMTPGSNNKIVTARLKLSELTPNRQSPEGFATSLHLASLNELLDSDLEQSFYLRLISESPGESATPQPLGKPVLDEGNHLSYAVQWILFALMGFFALFWGIRQEQEFRRMENNPNYVPRSGRSRKPSDGDIEDELLDANS
jgi:cytochrome oxidase assembly protein ShyY1